MSYPPEEPKWNPVVCLIVAILVSLLGWSGIVELARLGLWVVRR
jgi:hypothetical protein